MRLIIGIALIALGAGIIFGHATTKPRERLTCEQPTKNFEVDGLTRALDICHKALDVSHETTGVCLKGLEICTVELKAHAK